jgi:hypothetical protein
MKVRSILLAVLGLAVVLTVQFLTLDGVFGVLASFAFPDDTKYAVNYSAGKFSAVRRGDTESTVLTDLGEPLERVFVYSSGKCRLVWLHDGHVRVAYPEGDCGIKPGLTIQSVLDTLGDPSSVRWLYSTSPQGKSYRERIIVFRNGVVVERHSSYYVD